MPEKKSELARLTDFLFEAGMLRHTPRSGYQFLGSGSEHVAEHSFRTAIIGYALARRTGADVAKTVLLGLFHDFVEARTSDLNYVNQRYATADEEAALRDATRGTGFEEDILGLHAEFSARQSLEAQLARDADQLDLIFNLKRELDLGNAYATDWLTHVVGR
jgi:putative hydrolase of HD superfamily